ncbi:MAG TPA: PaaI family thioesterase [Kofleriaceae bacterium]|nr:PaaI family thioesterase [Kofleriaceae bacterium]
MSALLERIAAARAAGDLGVLVAEIPYAQFLGLRCAVDGGELVTTMAAGAHLVGNPALPAIHGGALGALLESAAAFALIWSAETALLPRTITITVDYLRSARPLDTHARAVVLRHGRRVATVRMEAWQEDRNVPVASAHGHFMIKRDEP